TLEPLTGTLEPLTGTLERVVGMPGPLAGVPERVARLAEAGTGRTDLRAVPPTGSPGRGSGLPRWWGRRTAAAVHRRTTPTVDPGRRPGTVRECQAPKPWPAPWAGTVRPPRGAAPT